VRRFAKLWFTFSLTVGAVQGKTEKGENHQTQSPLNLEFSVKFWDKSTVGLLNDIRSNIKYKPNSFIGLWFQFHLIQKGFSLVFWNCNLLVSGFDYQRASVRYVSQLSESKVDDSLGSTGIVLVVEKSERRSAIIIERAGALNMSERVPTWNLCQPMNFADGDFVFEAHYRSESYCYFFGQTGQQQWLKNRLRAALPNMRRLSPVVESIPRKFRIVSSCSAHLILQILSLPFHINWV
jgi:hypothetical protein